MIGWYTDNEISQTVMKSIAARGHQIKHVREYDGESESAFYGILRGTAPAIRDCWENGINFWYLDNGYFAAKYIDARGYKQMDGKYRIVRNDLIEVYTGPVIDGPLSRGKTFLLLPPSPYMAHFYETTEEQWIAEWYGELTSKGYQVKIRPKESMHSAVSLADEIKAPGVAGVLAFNSMGVMKAVEAGVPAYDTNGLFRNAYQIALEDFRPSLMHDYADVRAFYEPKNFTLQEIAEGKAYL